MYAHIHKIERGELSPSIDTLTKLLDALDAELTITKR